MTYLIRLFTEHDYGTVAAIFTRILDQPISSERLRWEDDHRPGYCKHQCWVAEADGQVVAWANYSQNKGMYHPDKFEVDMMVLPEYRGRGIGGALYEQLITALGEFDPASLLVGVREDWPEAIRFAEGRGFQERMRNWESHLDLPTADLSAFAPVLEQVAAKGYVIRSYTELAAGGEPDLDRRLHAWGQVVRRDIPTPEPLTDVPFEEWIQTALHNNPTFAPDLYMVALKDGAIVGISNMWRSEQPDVVTTGFTGISREHRGTGVAQALKVHAIAAARAAGFRLTKTWNASTNVKMLAINQAMGFVRKPAWISYVRDLKPEA